MNHRWKNDSCINCGIKRKKVTVKLLMAVVNHPPWEAYKYKQTHHFSFDGVKWRSERPSCQKLNSASDKICKHEWTKHRNGVDECTSCGLFRW